jgi:hypothetical protein
MLAALTATRLERRPGASFVRSASLALQSRSQPVYRSPTLWISLWPVRGKMVLPDLRRAGDERTDQRDSDAAADTADEVDLARVEDKRESECLTVNTATD